MIRKLNQNAQNVAMSSKPELNIDFCSHAAAKYAVEKWHYSRRMPSTYTKPVCLGIWEDKKFAGTIIFSMSSAKDLGKQYGFAQFERCELIRLSMKPNHRVSASRVIAIALRIIKKQSPGIKVVFSFADTAQGHHGGIYQAGNWIYLGQTVASPEYFINGRRWHGRAVAASFGKTSGFDKVEGSKKHRYAMPLDAEASAKLSSHRMPYPAREA